MEKVWRLAIAPKPTRRVKRSNDLDHLSSYPNAFFKTELSLVQELVDVSCVNKLGDQICVSILIEEIHRGGSRNDAFQGLEIAELIPDVIKPAASGYRDAAM